MGKQLQRAEFNNFIKGLITEASPLNFPENASLSEENFELKRDGTRSRRLGIGYEPGAVLRTAPLTYDTHDPSRAVSYVWKAVSGIETLKFLCWQHGNYITFFDVSASSISSAEGYMGQVFLSAAPSNIQFSFASINGRLVVATGSDVITVITFNSYNNFTVESDSITVRDVWGVQEFYAAEENDPSYRGVVLSDTHAYNLQNQSWGIPRKDSAGTLSNPVSVYASGISLYPSNSESVWPGLQFQPVAPTVTPYERMFPNLYTEAFGANPSAAKGYFVIDLLKRGTSRMSQFIANKAKHPVLTPATVTLVNDTTEGGATLVTEYAGRVWYSGFSGNVTNGDKRSPDLSSFLVFSQLVKSRQDITKCYEDTDPTSRESPGVVDTDGGFIPISGIERVVAMVNLELGLIVLGSNGVWVVTGGSEDGFKASNYKVSKISTSGCISKSTVVQANERVYYWSTEGIFVVGRDQVGALTAMSISASTIQSLYESIPNSSAVNSSGIYDPYSKKVRWLYHIGESFYSSTSTFELIFDTTLNAFNIHRLMPHPNVVVAGMFEAAPFRTGVINTITYSGVEPVYSGTDEVNTPTSVQYNGVQSIHYVIATNITGISQYTIGYQNNNRFKDWEEVDGIGVDAKAFLLTGALTGGNSAVSKQIPYLTMHFYRTEVGVAPDFTPDKPSGCLVQTRWDWSDSLVSNKWSTLSQAYRYRLARYVTGVDDDYETGFELVSSRMKVRGRGNAFQVYMETEPLKDCRIVGWSISVTGNTM